MINFHTANNSSLNLLKLITAATPTNGRIVVGAIEPLYVLYVNQFMIVLQLDHFIGQYLDTIASSVYVIADGFANAARTGMYSTGRKSK